jgi:hypothetical protein
MLIRSGLFERNRLFQEFQITVLEIAQKKWLLREKLKNPRHEILHEVRALPVTSSTSLAANQPTTTPLSS